VAYRATRNGARAGAVAALCVIAASCTGETEPARLVGLLDGRPEQARVQVGDTSMPGVTLTADGEASVFDVRVPRHAALWLAVGRETCTGPRVRVVIEARRGETTARVHERILSAGEACARWYPLRVSLQREAPQRIELAVRAETVGEAAAPPLVLIGDPLLVPVAPSPTRRNVVVVVAPMFNPGVPGALGRSAKRSPAFDELVGRGVLFLGARTSAGHPLLSHLALLTGRLPAAHDVTAVRDFATAVPTLATLLRAEGYLTGGVVRAGLVPPHVDLARGFHEYREYAAPPRDEEARRRMLGPEDARPLLSEAARWVRRTAPAEPFLLYVHLGASWFRGHDLRRYRASERRRYLARFYDRRMRGVDVALGEFFDEIDRLGVEPVVLLTSDDGQTAFARFVGRPDTEGRGPVPFVVAGPGIPAGARVVEPVRSTDVVPLLLDLAGIDPPPELSQPPVLPPLR